jgi:two-component system phosphate regulon response regulator PhoB
MKATILVVDDEPDAIELARFNLKRAGFDVMTAADGATALRKAREAEPDLIVLDLMLPELDGLEVCKIIRSDPHIARTPIIMLTAKAEEVDRVLGLELGADDYLTKPFSPRELVLRIQKVLGRRATPEHVPGLIHVGPIRIDLDRHEVTVNDHPVELTVTEFKLITLLAQRRGRVQTRERLLRDVWGYDTMIDTRTVDTHVRRLREKLGPAAETLDTVRGLGYRIREA